MTATSFNEQSRTDTADTLQRGIATLQELLAANLCRAKSPRLWLAVENNLPVVHMQVADPATNEFTQYTADLLHASRISGAKAGDNTIYLRMHGSNRFVNLSQISAVGATFLAGFIDAELQTYEANRGKPRYKPFVPPEFNPMGGS